MGAGETGNGLKSKRSVWLSERVGGMNPKSVQWDDEIKAAVGIK